MKNYRFLLLSTLLMICWSLCGQTVPPNKTIPAAQYYEGGQDAMYKFINENVRYPVLAKRNRIQGECIIHLTIEADGKGTNYSVVKNIGGGCGEEALRVVKLLKFKPPGFRVDVNIPVIYKL
ncbi:MAG: energy transducer TonB [Cytophagaceae bacterium]|nr:energy transducer TonB [Cytophagaceae bacterium]MDW8455508.1 energy transducer TonB [Cytophagaceae bacterium]